MTLKKLQDAIEHRKPVEFQYVKVGKVSGKRIGNPHAIFIFKAKTGAESTKVHIVQTTGVSDSNMTFPSFRMFDIESISDVVVLNDHEEFEIHQQYNPLWDGYKFIIAKV